MVMSREQFNEPSQARWGVLKRESSLAVNPGIPDLDEAEIDLTQLTKSSLTTNPLTRNSNDNDILLPVPCAE